MKKIIAFTLLLFGDQALSSVPLTGKISEIWLNDASNSNIAFVSTGQDFSSPCRTTEIRYLVIDLNEPGMKEAYSMALAAYMANMDITMAGNGACHGQHEKLKYINMIK